MQVDHLTKVHVSLAAGRSPEEMDLIPQPLTWTFVSGAGAGGLTPFEMACQQKVPGDEICLQIPAGHPLKVFEHLRPPILGVLPKEPPIYVRAVVQQVETATSREVVQAMSEATNNGAGGCGGDCGCGCG